MAFLPFRLAVHLLRGIAVNLALVLVLGLPKALIPNFVLNRQWTTVVHRVLRRDAVQRSRSLHVKTPAAHES